MPDRKDKKEKDPAQMAEEAARMKKFLSAMGKPLFGRKAKIVVSGVAAAAISGFAMPNLTKLAINMLEASKDSLNAGTIAAATAFMVLPVVALVAAEILKSRNGLLFTDEIRTQSQRVLISDAVNAGVDFYSKHEQSETSSKIGQATDLAINVEWSRHSLVLPQAAAAAAALGALLMSNPRLCALIGSISAARCYVTYRKFKNNIDAYDKEREINNEIFGDTNDIVGQHQAVAAYGRQSHEVARLDAKLDNALDTRKNTSRFYNNVNIFGNSLDMISHTTIIACALYAMTRDWNFGEFFLLTEAGNVLNRSLANLAMSYTEVVKEQDRLSGALADLPTKDDVMRDPEGAEPLSDPNGGVRFEKVDFAYNGTPIFEGLDLALAPGEKVALVGPSGAGKSTLAKLMLRLVKPRSGRIEIGGQDIAGATEQSLRDAIVVALQTEDTPAIFNRSIYENLAFRNRGLDRAQAWELLDAVGLRKAVESKENGIDADCERLSGGEKQRVVLARALAADDASVVVLDEPTSALDESTKFDCLDSMFKYFDGRTMLIITHDPRVAREMDRIVVVEGGKVKAQGSPGEVMESEAYRRLTASGRRVKRPGIPPIRSACRE